MTHKITIFEGAWCTARCSCNWFANKWTAEEAESVGREHLKAKQ